MVIGIVDNWDKDTGWVDDCILQGKNVTLLFSAYQDPNNTILCEHSEVEAFRESLQSRCRCVAYRNAAELKEKVTEPSAGKRYSPMPDKLASGCELSKRPKAANDAN